MWFSNRAQLNCGSTVSLSQPPQIVVPPPTVHHTTGAISSKPHHICRFFSPCHRFGVARRPLTCDCKLSWQSDMFLLYIKVGLVPTVWKVLTNFWQSVVNFPNPGTWSGPAAAAFCNSPLSFSAPNCSSVFSQLQPWFKSSHINWLEGLNLFDPGLSWNNWLDESAPIWDHENDIGTLKLIYSIFGQILGGIP